MFGLIQQKILAGSFEFTEHAVDQTIRRQMLFDEVLHAIAAGEVIEDYPNDRYGPSCLILGQTSMGRPLHVYCSYGMRALVKVITVYYPKPA